MISYSDVCDYDGTFCLHRNMVIACSDDGTIVYVIAYINGRRLNCLKK